MPASKEKNVQPIRTIEGIEDMKQALLRFCTYRDYFLFVFGINTGLRISDILKLRVSDIKNKKHIIIREQKNDNKRTITVTNTLQKEIDAYIRQMQDDDLLFPSRKGDKPISAIQAYRVLQKGAEMADIENVGTHTMRKTFGFHYYKLTKDVVTLMKIFGHAEQRITLRYIGIEQEQIDNSLANFGL